LKNGYYIPKEKKTVITRYF